MDQKTLELARESGRFMRGPYLHMACDRIAVWRSEVWAALSNGDTQSRDKIQNEIDQYTHAMRQTSQINSISDRCGYCGSGVYIIDNCPKCGAPPFQAREYERGEFRVESHEERKSNGLLFCFIRPKRKPIVGTDTVMR